MLKYKHIFVIVLAVFFITRPVTAADYQQLTGLIDTRTTFSDGIFTIEALALLAKKRGFDVLVINDHDRMAMEYGLFPFRNFIKKRIERNAINKQGAKNFLDAIKATRRKFPDLVLIPGSESTPFYYWTGSFFSRNLTAHDHEKRILTIGMEEPEDYTNLPLIHNGYSTRYLKHYLVLMIPFIISFLLSLLLIKERGKFRILGFIVGTISILLILNAHPFKSSPYDPYHGKQGIAPYQLLIDYVNNRGGFSFWNYPETRSGVHKIGPVFLNTPPYPEALEESQDYTGFSVIYGDTITVTEPGRQWDTILQEYCRGERKQPAWGIATADFHQDEQAGQKLGDFPTVFLVREKTRKEVLAAMRNGRMYASMVRYPQQIILKDFSILSSDGTRKATLGENILLKNTPRIRISLGLKKPAENRVKVRLIRSGKLIQTFKGTLPMEIDWKDPYFERGERIYYRIDVHGAGILLSNPIFVDFE